MKMEAILLEAMLLRLVMVSGRAVEWMIMMASRYLKQVRHGNGRTGLGCKSGVQFEIHLS